MLLKKNIQIEKNLVYMVTNVVCKEKTWAFR